MYLVYGKLCLCLPCAERPSQIASLPAKVVVRWAYTLIFHRPQLCDYTGHDVVVGIWEILLLTFSLPFLDFGAFSPV